MSAREPRSEADNSAQWIDELERELTETLAWGDRAWAHVDSIIASLEYNLDTLRWCEGCGDDDDRRSSAIRAQKQIREVLDAAKGARASRSEAGNYWLQQARDARAKQAAAERRAQDLGFQIDLNSHPITWSAVGAPGGDPGSITITERDALLVVRLLTWLVDRGCAGKPTEQLIARVERALEAGR